MDQAISFYNIPFILDICTYRSEKYQFQKKKKNPALRLHVEDWGTYVAVGHTCLIDINIEISFYSVKNRRMENFNIDNFFDIQLDKIACRDFKSLSAH